MKNLAIVLSNICISTPAIVGLTVLAVLLVAGVVFLCIKGAFNKKSLLHVVEWEPTQKVEEQQNSLVASTVSVCAENVPQSAPVEENTPMIDEDGNKENENDDEDNSDNGTKYKRSYLSKVIQANDDVKELYNSLKKHVLAYAGVRTHVAWFYESVYAKKINFVRFIFKGKTFCLAIALDPKTITNMKVEFVGNTSRTKDTPTLIRVKNHKQLEIAKKLVDLWMSQNNVEYLGEDFKNYKLDYKTDEELEQEGLLKRIESEKIAPPEDDPVVEDLNTPLQNDTVDIYLDDNLEIVEFKFDKSYRAKLCQLKDETKQCYLAIKQSLLNDSSIVSKDSWKKEEFFFGEEKIAEISVRGEKLVVSIKPFVSEKQMASWKLKINKGFAVVSVEKQREEKRVLKMITWLYRELKIPRRRKQPEIEEIPFLTNFELYKKQLVKFADKEQEKIYLEKWDFESREKSALQAHGEYFNKVQKSFEYFGDLAPKSNINLRYSNMARIISAGDTIKKIYNELKNKLLGAKGVVSRDSFSSEKFSFKGEPIAFIVCKQKSLKLYLSLRPASFDKNVFKHKNVGTTKKYQHTPLMVTVSNKRALKRALSLIDTMFEQKGYVLTNGVVGDFYPFFKTEQELIAEGLIKKTETFEIQKPTALKIPTIAEKFGKNAYVKKSFWAKLVQSDASVKKLYSSLSNVLESYQKVKSSLKWTGESFSLKGKVKAKFVFRKLRLVLCLDLDPTRKDLKKLKFENKSKIKAFQKTPVVVRLDKIEQLDNALTLVQKTFEGVAQQEVKKSEKSLKHVGTFTLIEQGFAKVAYRTFFFDNEKNDMDE